MINCFMPSSHVRGMCVCVVRCVILYAWTFRVSPSHPHCYSYQLHTRYIFACTDPGYKNTKLQIKIFYNKIKKKINL